MQSTLSLTHHFFFFLAPIATGMYIALVRQEANEASRSPGREAAGQHRVFPAVVGQELMRLRRRTLAVALACERELEQGAGICPLCGNSQQRCPSGHPGGLGSRAQPSRHGSSAVPCEEAEVCRRLGAKSATNLRADNS